MQNYSIWAQKIVLVVPKINNDPPQVNSMHKEMARFVSKIMQRNPIKM